MMSPDLIYYHMSHSSFLPPYLSAMLDEQFYHKKWKILEEHLENIYWGLGEHFWGQEKLCKWDTKSKSQYKIDIIDYVDF